MAEELKKHDSGVPLPSISSYMELENMFEQKSPLRGFVTLFWVIMASFVLQTITITWRSTGGFLGLNTYSMLSKNVVQLLLSDITMLLLSSLCFPIQYLISLGYFNSKNSQYLIQTVLESTFLVGFTIWTYTRNWYLFQKFTLIMHTMVCLMKMHSYSSMNQKFCAARKNYLEIKSKTPDSKLDDKVSLELRSQFSSKSFTSCYPNNVTIVNYLDYLLIPSLVYELEYPRTKSFRLGYFLEKVVALIGCVVLMYIAIEHNLVPAYISSPELSTPEFILKLIIPFTILHLLVFYILFEVVCNAFAELSRYADRNFYDDWWNSHNFLEYSSKWNKPVHKFLRVHVFLSLVETFKLRKRVALILTFLISSIAHEIVMAVTFKRINMVFFMFQMSQIPIITLMQLKFVANRPWLGNTFLWIGLCSGVPVISLFYAN